MSVSPRLPVALAVAGLVLISVLTGIGEACFAWAVVAGLRLAGFASATALGPFLFAVEPYRYVVNYWCTPATLVLCLLFLLWFAGQRPRDYLLAVLAFGGVAAALLVVNVVLSVHLHRDLGIAWPWAHRPGLVAVYALCLGACLRFVLRAQARGRAA